MKRTLRLLAALLIGLPQVALAAWTETDGAALVEQEAIRTWAETFTTTLGDGTTLDVRGCATTPLVSFDASTGDASADASIQTFSCDTATQSTGLCDELQRQAGADGTVPSQFTDVQMPVQGGFFRYVKRSPTTGGDTAQVSVKCGVASVGTVSADAASLDYDPTDPADWSVVPENLLEASDELADKKQNVSDTTVVSEGEGDPDGVLNCTAPNCLRLDEAGGVGYASAGSTNWFLLGNSANVAQDTDGDLAPDQVYCSDFDGDETLEVADLRLCQDALTDSGDKTVIVLPGSYAPPADPEVDYPATGTNGAVTFGLVEVESDTTFQCISDLACKVTNSPIGDSGQDYAVFSNVDHTLGNSDIAILGFEIDGAEGDVASGSASLSVNQRMGIYLRGTTRARIERNFVHDTHHTCIYTSNSTDDLIHNNALDDCGGADHYLNSECTASVTPAPCCTGSGTGTCGTTPIAQPGVYLFATGSHSTTGTRVLGNRISRAKGNGINTRVNTSADSIVDIEIVGNSIADGVRGTGYAISIRGVDGALIQGNTSLRYGGGLITYDSASTYRSYGATNFFESSRRLQVLNNVFKDSNHATSSNAGMYIGPYLEDSVFQGNVVDGTTTTNVHCLQVKGPHRRVRFDDFKLSRCAGFALTDVGVGSRAGPEAWIFNGLRVDGTDWIGKTTGSRFNGILFNLAHDGFELRNARISGSTEAEIQFNQSMTNTTIEDVIVDSTDPGYLGFFTVATLPACNSGTNDMWAVVDDANGASDCTTGASTTDNACFCNGTVWANFSRSTHEAIEFADGTVDHATNRLLHLIVKNTTNGNDGSGLNNYIRLADGSGYVLDDIACVDDSLATTTAAASCVQFFSADNGPGEFTGIRMTNVRSTGLTNPDVIAIDEGAGGDDLFSTEFSFIDHRQTSAPTTTPFAVGVCTGANGSTIVDTDDADDGTFYCENGTFVPVVLP